MTHDSTTPDQPTPANSPAPTPAPPLVSPMPRSPVLDREEPELANEGDNIPTSAPSPSPPPTPSPSGKTAADDDAQSMAGEEDPGAGIESLTPGRRE